MIFYGLSFIVNKFGEKAEEADRDSEDVLVHKFDLEHYAKHRAYWGVFCDRRPEHYGRLQFLDGQ